MASSHRTSTPHCTDVTYRRSSGLQNAITLVAGQVLLGCLGGCSPAPLPPPPPPPATKTVATPTTTPAAPIEESGSIDVTTPVEAIEPVDSETRAEPSDVEVGDAPPNDPNSGSDSSTAGNENESTQNEGTHSEGGDEEKEDAELAQAPADRIMLLTDYGPLLIDLRITIEGVPHQQSFDSVIEEVMSIADEDGDGIVTWEALMSHPRFRDGQFGNPATTTYQAQQDMVRLYDTTQNERVDADELVRYLSSNQGTSRAMSLLTSNYRRVMNRDDSPIRKWLDINDDLVIDESEIARASRRMRLRDTNDDEILLPSDFVDSIGMQNGMTMRRRPRDSEYLPKVGWTIAQREPWSDMRVAWDHYYAINRGYDDERFAVSGDLFDQLDIDDSGSVDNLEMEMLTEVPSHIELDIELVQQEQQASSSVTISALRIPPDQLLAVVQHQPNRVTLQLPDTSIDIFARDNIGYAAYDQQAMNFLMQADGDSNDYLDEDEFNAIGQFLNSDFEAADLDGNGKLFQDEIVTILEQRNMVSRNQLSIRADDQDDALLPSVDLNSDGRIDSREIARIGESLLALDHNDDGRLELHELRGTMMVGVVRGGNRGQVQPNDTTYQVPTVDRKNSESTPRWFIGMDRNRDGGISWREFLGARTQFDELDANSDGFVVESEVADN